MAASIEIIAHRNRTTDHSIALYDAAGTAIAIANDDIIRVKIGKGNAATPTLDLTSSAATANGSEIEITQTTAPATFNLRLAQADLTGLYPGAYDLEILVVDASDIVTSGVAAIKHCQNACLQLIGQMAGGTT